MKKHLWAGCKFVIPIILLYSVARWVYEALEKFWMAGLLGSFPFLTEGAHASGFKFFAIVFSTIVVLTTLGKMLNFKYLRIALDFVSTKIFFLRFFWSGGEEFLHSHKVTPVLFQHPMGGQWKIGFNMGIQKMDNGKRFHKIFFVTGVGDHELIDADRDDLIVPLTNNVPEVFKLISSFMATGPNFLKIVHKDPDKKS